MQFYTRQHQFYCGIDLHRNIRTDSEAFLRAIRSYREDIPFVLGHAQYVQAIHGGNSKNDKIDSKKVAALFQHDHAALTGTA